MSGVNLILPAASTLLDTVTMAARADLARRRLHRDIAAVPADLAGRRRQRQRDLLAKFGDQRAEALAAGDRGVAILRADLVDHRDVFQILAHGIGAEHEFRRARPVAEIFRQTDAQDTSALPRDASSMARLARTRAARNSSVSPARALRRPMRIFWPSGAAAMSSPALRASLIIGLVSGLCIQRAPRSNGTSNVAVSVRHRPPIWADRPPPRSPCGSPPGSAAPRRCRRHRRRSRQCRPRAATPRPSADAKDRTKSRRVSAWLPRRPTGNRAASLSCQGFRKLLKQREHLANLPHPGMGGNHHGESIMIDRLLHELNCNGFRP
jgi:hypothetical protein